MRHGPAAVQSLNKRKQRRLLQEERPAIAGRTFLLSYMSTLIMNREDNRIQSIQ